MLITCLDRESFLVDYTTVNAMSEKFLRGILLWLRNAQLSDSAVWIFKKFLIMWDVLLWRSYFYETNFMASSAGLRLISVQKTVSEAASDMQKNALFVVKTKSSKYFIDRKLSTRSYECDWRMSLANDSHEENSPVHLYFHRFQVEQ